MPTTPIESWGDVLRTSFTSAFSMFLSAIPRIIGFLVIFIIGWIIANLIAGVVARLLRQIKFNELADRSGFTSFVHNMGVQTDASGFLAGVVRWFLRPIVLVVAFDALGLPAVSVILQGLLLWLPNLIVALVVLVIAGLAANALHGLVRGASAQSGLGNPDLLANFARVMVIGFGIVVALNQLRIASSLVNTLFMAIVGAMALAFGLAFGLGGRETAGEIVHNWYARSQEAATRIQEGTSDGRDETVQPMQAPSVDLSAEQDRQAA